jgi:Ca2+-binding RTX toxin-like protein
MGTWTPGPGPTAGNDTFVGDGANDVIDGLDGNDILNGNGGDDILTGGYGIDQVYAGAGHDILLFQYPIVSGEVYDGGADSDWLQTSAPGQYDFSIATVTSIEEIHFNVLFGDNSVLFSSAQLGAGLASTLKVYSISAAPGPIAISNATLISIVMASAGTADISGWDFVWWQSEDRIDIAGSGGADVIHGANVATYLSGGDGNDTLIGGLGDDILFGDAGADRLEGGAGDDQYYVDSYSDQVVESAGAGLDRMSTALPSFALPTNVEELYFIGVGPFIGIGNDDANKIVGGSDNDYFYGYDGDDAMAGLGGIDVFVLGAGNDFGNGGDGQDYLFGETGNDTLYGGAGVDVLIGGSGDDHILGGTEGDYIYGDDGNDDVYGEEGNDIFVMGAGNDIADGGDGQDYFYMGDGDDVMRGGAGVDVMLGEAGNDLFDGGAGVDYLFLGPGGAGDNDRVVVNKLTTGVEVVNGFEAGGSNDVVELLGSGWTNMAQVQAAIFDYTASGGFCVLTLDADTAIWFIGVTPGQLTSADFVFNG